MSSFARGIRLGAGLVALGYGTYRMAKGRRNWMTNASLSTGVSMVLGGLRWRSPFRRGAQVVQAAQAWQIGPNRE